MPFTTLAECVKDWTIVDGEVMVLAVPLKRYTSIIEHFRLALNISEDEMKARTSFCYMPTFNGFHWLEINLSCLFPFVPAKCWHQSLVDDQEVGMNAFHGSKAPLQVAYSREFHEAYNLRQGKRGLYHAPDVRTALQYATPLLVEDMEWRCVFDIQVHIANVFLWLSLFLFKVYSS